MVWCLTSGVDWIFGVIQRAEASGPDGVAGQVHVYNTTELSCLSGAQEMNYQISTTGTADIFRMAVAWVCFPSLIANLHKAEQLVKQTWFTPALILAEFDKHEDRTK